MAVTEGKIVLIGAGMVGSAILSSIISMNVVSEVAVIDMNENKDTDKVRRYNKDTGCGCHCQCG